ncbi:MAG: formate dehydrogenase subunit delta [Hyphomicrobium sp.]|jgi:formate dehydrogenase subunit delta
MEQHRELIRMANQIAAFFEAYPRTEALSGIAAHIRNFWTPRMRQQMTEYIEGGAEGLSPLVTAALASKAKAKS